MKMFTKIAALILASTVSALSAMAQTQTTHVNIPFAFHAAGKTLPAGTYTISSQLTLPVVSISQFATKVNLQTVGFHDSWSRTKPSTIVFNRIGSEYFLREIVPGASSSSVYFPQAKAEKQARLRNDLAGLSVESNVVLATK